jgi:hypothetical protein
MPPKPQPVPFPNNSARPPNPKVKRVDVLRKQREPNRGNPIPIPDHGTTPVLLGQWTGGNGLGFDGSFYVTFPTAATGVVLTASGNESLKPVRSNNQPQYYAIYLLNDWNITATLLSSESNYEWITLQDAIENPLIQICGSSVDKYGENLPDYGVIVRVSYFQNGVELAFNFDDCGSLGGNSDGDFKDKQVLLWIPIVYQKDFNTVSPFVEGNGNGNLIIFAK